MPKRIDSYVPKMDPAYWAEIEDFVRAAISDCNPDRWSTARPWMSAVAGLTLWCWQSACIELTYETVFAPTTISRYLASREDITLASKGTTRSVLLRLSERLIGVQGEGTEYRRYPNSKGSAPYTQDEITRLISYVSGQGSSFRRRNATLVLALGLGAGLHTTEMLALLPEHIEEEPDGHLVHVPGKRARAVPVVAAYDELLRDSLRAVRRESERRPSTGFLVLPERAQRDKNTVIDLFYKCDGDGLRPQTQRLRSTWIVGHLNARTPVPVVLRAAGVTETSTLGRYLKFLDPVDAAAEVNFLRLAAP